jgi:hypothetical protein
MQEVAQARFDFDYKNVRRALLQGKFELDIAKMWIRKHGAITASDVLTERRNRLQCTMGTRADRELEQMRMWDKRRGVKEEDDE